MEEFKNSTQEFTNTLFTGDNLYFLCGLNSQSVDLIYLDPPFNSKRIYMLHRSARKPQAPALKICGAGKMWTSNI
jgi:16S rRNA G966 N2-methylase RsmD